jgi:hypothetical protein
MTQEDKAKAYDKALKVIKDNLDALDEIAETGAKTVNIQTIKNCFHRAFPELKESEDERIRKELLEHCINRRDGKQVCVDASDYRRWANWLEKQGEQKQDPCDNCKDVMLNCHNFPCVKKRAFEQGKSVLEVIKEDGEIITYSETDGYKLYQPKFKVGDWVILTVGELSDALQIVNVDTNKKRYWFNDNSYLPIDDEECLHLYTIEDAKDGDVLNSPSHHLIWIYKDNKHYYACVNMNYVTENVATNGLISIPNDACPATKEQRNQLKKAMADAGYTFDKKELKKIEQKPAWSEEDEKILSEIIDFFENGILTVQHDFRIYASWLKSLKQKYTWKPSDKQMNTLRHVISGCSYDIEPLVEMEEQLKKLK